MMQREALNWGRLFNLFHRPSPEDETAPTGDYTDLAATFRTIGKAVWDKGVLPQAPGILRQIAAEAKKQGIGEWTSYLYYVLFEAVAQWPDMSEPDKSALRLLKRIITEAGTIPNYYNDLAVPEGDKEGAVDVALKALAVWARTTFKTQLEKDYVAVLNRYVNPAALRLGLWDTSGWAEDAKLVREAFETQVIDAPVEFGTYGRNLWHMMRIIKI